jgi:hypothetical protein
MNLIPFNTTGANLPAYLKNINLDALNADLTVHAGGGYPVVSIKGKVFAIVRDGERRILPNPKDPESAATSIEVVLLKVNKSVSKVFYLKGYDKDAAEGQKPDCYSNDGTAPAADSKAPQAKNCASCPNNQWGSKITDNGGKGKACADSVRMAVAPAGQLNDVMLLRVPPATIRALGEYGQSLQKHGVGYPMVVTKIGFDQEAESPKLTFKALGMLDQAGFEQVQELQKSDLVRNILQGTVFSSATDSAIHEPEVDERMLASAQSATKTVIARSKTVSEDEVAAAVQAAPQSRAADAPKSKATAKHKAAAKPSPSDLEIDLNGMEFDD